MNSKPKQEELRKAFVEQLKGINVKADPDSLFIDECLELVNLEVTSVLDELKKKKGVIATGYDGQARTEFTDVVPIEAIQSIRSRYE